MSVPLFSSDITNGYKDLDEAKGDFGEMAKFLLNGAIMDNVKAGVQQPMNTTDMAEGSSGGAPTMEMGNAAAMADSTGGGSGGTAGKAVGDSVTDFGTNNQEKQVDQSDIAKSNGAYIFTAYGQYLIVVDVATGALLDEIEMKEIEYTPPENCEDWGQPYPLADTAKVANSTNGTSVAAGDAVMGMIISPCYYKPTPYIQALALDGDRLTVIVSGYGQEYTSKMDTMPTIYEYLGTRILVYSIGTDGSLTLLSTKDVNGYFLNAFTISGNTHVVTQVRKGIPAACYTVPYCLS